MMCPYLLISINELLISIIPFIDINKYGLNVKTAAHRDRRTEAWVPPLLPDASFFFGVRIRLGMNFNYLILWVTVKGQG